MTQAAARSRAARRGPEPAARRSAASRRGDEPERRRGRALPALDVPRGVDARRSAPLIGGDRHVAGPRLHGRCPLSSSRIVRGRPRPDRATSRRTSTSIATYLLRPDEGEVSAADGVHPQQRHARRGVPSFTIISNRCVHLGCPVQANGLPIDEQSETKASRDQPRSRGPRPSRPPASAARATAASTTTRATAPPARRCGARPLQVLDQQRAASSSADALASARSTARAPRRRSRPTRRGPGQTHVDGLERWLYIPVQPPQLNGRRPTAPGSSSHQRLQRPRCTRSTGSRSASAASSAATKCFLFRKVPRDISWGAHARLGRADRVHRPGDHRRDPRHSTTRRDPDEAYESIRYITDDLTLGWLVRGMHSWGASVFIILLFLHMGRVFLFGAYKYPRELNWIIGVLILAGVGLFEGFTGYLLPWDQTAYWATVVGDQPATRPRRSSGPFLAHSSCSGGAEIGPDTLAPLLLAAHAAHTRGADRADRCCTSTSSSRLGVSARRRGRARRQGRRRGPPPPPRARLVAPATARTRRRLGDGRGERTASRTYAGATRRASSTRGKPFFPYAMFHDTVMSLVVVCVIVALAVRLVLHGGRTTGEDSGCSARSYDGRGRPGHDELRPAARLVLLLPLLPPADLQVAGLGPPRDRRHPDDRADPAARAAVLRPAPRAAARCGGRWPWSRRC